MDVHWRMSNPQFEVWNDTVGGAWSANADHYDAMLEPFGDAAIRALAVGPHERVLDVGCGTGATTVRLAGAAASVVGVDLSAPMLAIARQRAAAASATNVEFVQSDLEAAPPDATFDIAFSRFGVMFFGDPVRAFTHVRAVLVDGGRLGFVCFQAPLANPFIVVPVMAAAAHLPVGAPPGPGEPSPFSFADPDRVTSVLAAAGFSSISIEPGPASVTLGPADEIDQVARRVLEQNPTVAAGLAMVTPDVQAAAVAATASALSEHIADGNITLAAGTWVVTATAA
jgi:SAM-dependent methyltransferase